MTSNVVKEGKGINKRERHVLRAASNRATRSPKDGGNYYYYHVAFDDGDKGDCTWGEIQLGIRWQAAAWFTPAPHYEELPTGALSSAGGL